MFCIWKTARQWKEKQVKAVGEEKIGEGEEGENENLIERANMVL